ncbi:MAG: WS/DGAT/MGAT family O-acyltransferase [Stenotrophobium sp.]
MKRMNPLDASWLAVESQQTPMHVGNLQIFSLPKNAPDDFINQWVAHLKTARDFAPPWNLKLRSALLGRLLPSWKTDNDLDLDYHLRHSALPHPGGERELGVLISRLHSHELDLKRPLWECHVIEGLEHKRFALYTKMHHSLIDGVGGVRLLQRILSTDANAMDMPAPWTVRPDREPRPDADKPSTDAVAKSAMQGLRAKADTVPQLVRALRSVMRGSPAGEHGLTAPFSGPKSVINHRVTGQRRFATQQYEVGKLKALAKAADCSLNDIVLYLCATGLRRFMLEANSLPDRPLTTGIPVNVRPKDDQGTGNAISFIIANLATDIADPLRRLEAIKESTARAKEHLQSLPRSAIMQYTVMLMAPYMLQLITGLGGRMRPVFNVTISNVPGPDQPLFYNGAKLEAMFPVSLIAHGGALNITCLSYAGTLNFGFTGCRDTLPHMQRLAVYTGEALDELEALLAPGKRKRAGG